jgi:hypothetical protein
MSTVLSNALGIPVSQSKCDFYINEGAGKGFLDVYP